MIDREELKPCWECKHFESDVTDYGVPWHSCGATMSHNLRWFPFNNTKCKQWNRRAEG